MIPRICPEFTFDFFFQGFEYGYLKGFLLDDLPGVHLEFPAVIYSRGFPRIASIVPHGISSECLPGLLLISFPEFFYSVPPVISIRVPYDSSSCDFFNHPSRYIS